MTDSTAIETWLKQTLAWKRFGAALSGLGLLLVAALVLLVTFWIVYAIIFFATFSLFPFSHETRLMVSGVVLVLLFIGNATLDRRYLESYSFSTGTIHDKPVTLNIPFVGRGSTINPLAPDSMHSQIKVIASVVCFGPRLATAAVRFFWQFWRLSRLDVEGCAAVLEALAAADGPVPFDKLASAVPDGHDAGGVLTQVQNIFGVRLVTSEPPGLSLLTPLREELQKLDRRGDKRKKRKAKEAASGNDKPLVSLVLLLPEPRDLDAELLAKIVNRTFGFQLDLGEKDSTEFVVGEPPMLIAQFGGYAFQVLTAVRPYFDDIEAAAGQMTELRLRKVLTEHRAWLSVDLLHQYGDDSPKEPYWYIGKLLAALAPSDALALLCPGRQHMRLWEAGVKKALGGDNPLEALTVAPEKVPVVAVPDDDPRMKAAVAEARRRWPEFVQAFGQRQPDQVFSVKVPIRDGEYVEHMWLSVLSIEDEVIVGQLDSEPVNVKKVRLGSRLKVRRGSVSDWLYMEGEAMMGGFTVKVLQGL